MIYHVILQDEQNNLFHCGFYTELSDAIPLVNDFLKSYNVQIDELSTFDRKIETKKGTIMIRGFIFDNEYLKEIL